MATRSRAKQGTAAWKQHGGWYLGAIGGPAARWGQDYITKGGVVKYEGLGMEGIWKIEVKNFPACIIGDDKGGVTGAVERKEGRLQRADGGTLFLTAAGMTEALVTLNIQEVRQVVDTDLIAVRSLNQTA